MGDDGASVGVVIFLIGAALVSPIVAIVLALATEIIPLEVMGEGTGWFMVSNSLGAGIGPLLGLLVAGAFDYSALY